MKRARKRYLKLLCCTTICLVLAACGQRGPLFLPDQNDPPGTTGEGAPTNEPAEEDKEEKEDAESGL
jgi:predicted small lipoprotein YifL